MPYTSPMKPLSLLAPLTIALGCATTAAPVAAPSSNTAATVTAPEPTPATAALDEPTPTFEFNFHGTSLPRVAAILSEVFGRPVVLSSALDRAASCMTLTVANHAPVTLAEAVALIELGLGDEGVRLDVSDEAIVFRVADTARLPDCAPPTVSATTEPETTSARAPRPPTAPGLEGLRRVDATHYLLTTAAVEGVLQNPSQMMRSGRVVPHYVAGQAVGLRLFGIRRGSLFGHLGFINGDSLRTVNGFDITTPQSALEAYAQARNAERLTVQLTRRGQEMTLEYRIVEALPE